MSQRVTLDHPDIHGRARTNTSSTRSAATSRFYQKPVVAPALARKNLPPITTPVRKPLVSVDAVRTRKQIESFNPATERSLAETVAYSDSYNNRSHSSSKWRANSVYTMAVMLFAVGMFVAIYGFVVTTRANNQVEVLGEVIKSGNTDDVRRLAQSIPNEDDVSDYDVSSYTVGPDMPRYIRIPSIGVKTTRVLEAGLEEGGAIGTPEGIYDTSWYSASASLTDESGAMFISGHYVGPNKAGVFYNLTDVKKGNIIEIEDGDGDLSHFRIIDMTEYDINNVDMVKALTPVSEDRLGLNLMTCAGKWDANYGQYDRRTLVRAEKI